VVGVGALTEIWLQWVLFSVLAVVSLGLFRRRLLSRMKSPAAKDLDSLQGEVVEAADTIAPGAVGQGYLRGTTWRVHNMGAAILTRGQRAVVERVDGVTLRVKPE
jgi:membrane protein implicated in regulation of membrane protease activity